MPHLTSGACGYGGRVAVDIAVVRKHVQRAGVVLHTKVGSSVS